MLQMRTAPPEIRARRKTGKFAEIIDEMRLIVIAAPLDDVAPIDARRSRDLPERVLESCDPMIKLRPKADLLRKDANERLLAQSHLLGNRSHACAMRRARKHFERVRDGRVML